MRQPFGSEIRPHLQAFTQQAVHICVGITKVVQYDVPHGMVTSQAGVKAHPGKKVWTPGMLDERPGDCSQRRSNPLIECTNRTRTKQEHCGLCDDFGVKTLVECGGFRMASNTALGKRPNTTVRYAESSDETTN
jgi:hypothetical protein